MKTEKTAITCEECGHMDGSSGCDLPIPGESRSRCPKDDQVISMSATLIMDTSLYNGRGVEGVITNLPDCPKCGDKLIPVTLGLDTVGLGGVRGMSEHYHERQISDMTAWICNMSCDAKNHFTADIGPVIRKDTGEVVEPTPETKEQT